MQDLKGAKGYAAMLLAMRNALLAAVAAQAPAEDIREILDELEAIEAHAPDVRHRRSAAELIAQHSHLVGPAHAANLYAC